MSASVFTPAWRGVLPAAPARSPGAGSDQLDRVEAARCGMVSGNRAYYHGTQYDHANDKRLDELRAELKGAQTIDRVPEHERLHAYSTQIAECVDYIASQLTDGFAFQATDPQVQAAIDGMLAATDALTNGTEDEEVSFDDLMIEGAQAGDTPYLVQWDPIDQTAYFEFWPAEQVRFETRGMWVRKVVAHRTVVEYVSDGRGGETPREVQHRIVYDLAYRTVGLDALQLGAPEVEDAGQRQCRRRLWKDGDPDEEPSEEEWLRLPFIPWGVLRVDKKGISGYRGDPLITRRALDNADRYNANEQHAYIVARYNSHGNLGVVGDQAMLKVQLEPAVPKDVADVLTFPGGTALVPITLPTDPRMIEHTRQVTADAMYASFGLVRVEPDTLGGLGGVTGYALEILNRRSEGTFRRIRRTFKNDCLRMINMALDLHAYRAGAQLEAGLADLLEQMPEVQVTSELLPDTSWWEVDPEAAWPNREIEVRMGTGYIVDDVQIRDDYTAGLISHEEALRLRGYSNEEIEDMKGEEFAGASSGEGTVVPLPPALPNSPIGAGSTTGSTERR